MSGLLSGKNAFVTGYDWKGMEPQDAHKVGLGLVNNAAHNFATQDWNYPGYQAHKAPVQMDYANYVKPQFQQLMGGDYDKLEQALYKGGAAAADAQYDRGQRDIANVMGGRGIYGSSMMGTQMQDLTRHIADTKAQIAGDAARARYSLQAQELSRLNALAAMEAESRNAYNRDATQWDYTQKNLPILHQNMEIDRQQEHAINDQVYRQNVINQLFGMGVGMAGGSASAVNQNAALAAQKSQQQAQQKAQREQALWGGLAGGLLSGFTPNASGDTAFGKIYDTVSSWF